MQSESNNEFDNWLAPIWSSDCSAPPFAHSQLHGLHETSANSMHSAPTASDVSHIAVSGATRDQLLGTHPRKRPHLMTNAGKESNADSQAEKVKILQLSRCRLIIVRQPEEQHRARYLSEGSRGAIKDRSGTSNCTIQLCGFYRPTRVELFASCMDSSIPHPLYRLIPVSGKAANVTPCRKVFDNDGIECLEIILRPESNMTAVLDCVGILKVRTYDAKRKSKDECESPGSVSSRTSASCSTTSNSVQFQNSVRLTIRAYIPNDAAFGGFQIVQTETDPIRCVQQLGIPEVLKMSCNKFSAQGGGELFIVGRNFDRNTKVLFREYREDGTLGWSAEAFVDKQFLHQCHIVCTIPPYPNLRRGGTVSVTVICASKSSHPRNFTYIPYEEEDDWRPPSSPHPAPINEMVNFTDYDNQHQNYLVFEKNCCPSLFYDNVSNCANTEDSPENSANISNNYYLHKADSSQHYTNFGNTTIKVHQNPPVSSSSSCYEGPVTVDESVINDLVPSASSSSNAALVSEDHNNRIVITKRTSDDGGNSFHYL